jgi:putative transposase
MQPGRIYHIYNHGNASDNLFRSDDNFRYFLQKYTEHIQPVASTYAYCLMPNHFHFLVRVNDEQALRLLPDFERLTGTGLEERTIKRFSNLFNAYTKAFNKMYGRRGKLFLTPFQRKPVSTSRHFVNTWKYIHYNPVHHGFVRDVMEWPHSSVHDYRMKNSNRITIADAQRQAESSLDFNKIENFIPDWNDFLELQY